MSLKGNLSAPNAITVINFVWMTVVTGMLTATAVLYDSSTEKSGLTANAGKPSITVSRYYDSDYYSMGYSRQQ